LEYDFLVIYNLGKSHFVGDALSQMFAFTEESGIPDQTIDVLFYFSYNRCGYKKFMSTSLLENFQFSTTMSKRKS
jgi:hypothetical protein